MSRSISTKIHIIIYAILTLFLIGIIIYSILGLYNLNKRVTSLSIDLKSLEGTLASTTAELRNAINQTHTSLSNELNQEKQTSAAIEQKLGNYERQVSTVSGTVDTLQKLSKTDPELLQKYSKVFFLNEYYAPARLSEIPTDYTYSNTKILKFQTDVWPHLKQLLDDSKRDGVTTYVFSSYRSFNEQSALKNQYKITYGAGSANQFSADQGYSEHQLGTAVDLITSGLGGVLDGFDTTASYTWLQNNAYKYGFILSYPKDNTFYVFEPWHWRYVGVKLATDLHNQGKNFYNLDQRKIDEYLVNFFE